MKKVVGKEVTKKIEYTEDSIDLKVGLEHVRTRPSVYAGAIIQAAFHCFKEVYDNSIDEFLNGHCDVIKVSFSAKKNTITVEDNGRGIPCGMHKKAKRPTLEIVFTELGSGGKFDKGKNKAFKRSSGLNGKQLMPF